MIAVVAFQPWESTENPNQGRTLTVSSLAATMASLLQAGFGRVVVVGHGDDDLEIAQETFRLLYSTAGATTRKVTAAVLKDDSPISRIGQMEVGYASYRRGTYI
jgi:hypothetical protein